MMPNLLLKQRGMQIKDEEQWITDSYCQIAILIWIAICAFLPNSAASFLYCNDNRRKTWFCTPFCSTKMVLCCIVTFGEIWAVELQRVGKCCPVEQSCGLKVKLRCCKFETGHCELFSEFFLIIFYEDDDSTSQFDF